MNLYLSILFRMETEEWHDCGILLFFALCNNSTSKYFRSLISSSRFLSEASTQSQTASSSSKEAVPAKNRCNTFLSIYNISTSRKQPPKILSGYFRLLLFSGYRSFFRQRQQQLAAYHQSASLRYRKLYRTRKSYAGSYDPTPAASGE